KSSRKFPDDACACAPNEGQACLLRVEFLIGWAADGSASPPNDRSRWLRKPYASWQTRLLANPAIEPFADFPLHGLGCEFEALHADEGGAIVGVGLGDLALNAGGELLAGLELDDMQGVV